MATSRVLGSASSGIARALGSVMGGGQAYQQGFDGEVQAQSQIARALAQVRQAEAAAELDRQKARNAEAEGDVMRGRSALADELMAAAGGVDVPTMTAFRTKLRTGEAPQVPMGPPAEDGSMGLGRAQFDEATSSRLGQALLRLAPVMQRTTDIGPDDWAKMLGAYSDQDLRGQVLAGERTAGQVGAAQAAMAGKPLFNADSTGSVLDLFGGRLAVDNPMAQSTIGLRGQQAAQAKAAATENYAQADSARATAARTRQAATLDAAEGRAGAGGRAPVGYRWTAAGTLEPIPGGPADPNTKGAKLAKPPAEGQAKALLFASRMAVADDVLSDMERKGVNKPGVIKSTAEGIAGAVPIIGGSLATGAGALTNWTQSAEQQQVEQARRDFINAVLRRESGAVIADSEFANAAQQYFPQPGDSPAVLRQKAANRRAAIAGISAEFGEPMRPEFDRIVQEARQQRGGRLAVQPAPSAGDDWTMPAAPPAAAGGWKIERVR